MLDATTPSEPDNAPETLDRRTLLSGVRTVVVKVGTNVLVRPNGEMALARIHALVEDLVDLHRQGLRLILVTSGAISMGMDRLGLKERPPFLPDKQACAAVGQVRLMEVYQQAFDRFDIATGQILLTEGDFTSRHRYLNLRNTMNRLLELRVLPIVNENDTVSTTEIEEVQDRTGARAAARPAIFGDNDVLSALVASKLGADLLVILSDVDGLFPVHPMEAESRGAGEKLLPIAAVPAITPEIEAMAGKGNARGRGGMTSKLEAARIAVQSGVLAVIANGSQSGILKRVLGAEVVGTIFLPGPRRSSRKRWIAYASPVNGQVRVHRGARDAILSRGSSLLFAGVLGVDGDFQRGDVVSIFDEDGHEFARGIVNYSAEEARPLAGKRSSEIAQAAGHDYEELITRDNIAERE